MNFNRIAISDCIEAEATNRRLRQFSIEDRNACSSHLLLASLRIAFYVFCISLLLLLAGCRQDMHDQPKIISQRGSTMFADHRGARPQVMNTVARGQLRDDTYFYTGIVEGANGYREESNLMPFPVNMEVLQRGQERFNIYCSPCHSRVGNGLGEVVRRGYKPAANLHDQVRLSQPVSHYFYVMTHGYGAMPDYAAQLSPADRWAVAAYIRALQLSQKAKEENIPPGLEVMELKDIAAGIGRPDFAEPWELPATSTLPSVQHAKPSDHAMLSSNATGGLNRTSTIKPSPAASQ